MTFYAHAVIELEDGQRIQRGDFVPDSLEGLDELVEAGSVSDQPYSADDEPAQIPDYVEIDGVRYVKTTDASTEASDAS